MSYGRALEEALAAYQRRREELATLQGELREVTGKATAPRQVVSVTVGQRGELTELRFPTNAYKNMTPAELSSTILKTFEEARNEALSRSAELMTPLMPSGMDVEGVLRGKVDLMSMLPKEPRSAEDRQLERGSQA